MLKRIRLLVWVLVAAALAGLAVLLLSKDRVATPPVASTPLMSIGGPFTLTDSKGQNFASSRLAGKPFAIFFGFTHCPDVCPTTLARMARLRRQSGGDETMNIVFVTVDPERDGPEEVGKYAELFNAPIIGLTGTPAQIAQVKKQFGIFSEKVPDGSGSYSVDHSATVLLFDRNGDFVATISTEEPDDMALAKIRRIAA